MARRDILDKEHVVRCCSIQKQIRDAEGNIIGLTPEAFSLRHELDEKYLSVALLETIPGDTIERLTHIRKEWVRNKVGLGKKAAAAICNAGTVRSCGINRGHNLRVCYEPKRNNNAYSAIRRLPYDNSDQELLLLLSTEAVDQIHLLADLD